MTAKKTDWSVEKLEEWAGPALDFPELIDIARTATSNTEAKNRALKFTAERGLAETVAKACRWLHILRVKCPERFETLTMKEEKEMGEKKFVEEIEFDLPDRTELIARRQINSPKPEKIAVKFFDPKSAGEFCKEILNAWIDTVPSRSRDLLVQIFEEKFGIKIKICGHCGNYNGVVQRCTRIRDVVKDIEQYYLHEYSFGDSCGYWAPKEVLEKK